jgi:PEGA domain
LEFERKFEMKTILAMALLSTLLAGCDTGPVISKSYLGNLEINVVDPNGGSTVTTAEIYLDGRFIGNPTGHMPILNIKSGERVIRVTAPGYKPYEKTVIILGEPNHQALNVFLEKQ